MESVIRVALFVVTLMLAAMVIAACLGKKLTWWRFTLVGLVLWMVFWMIMVLYPAILSH